MRTSINLATQPYESFRRFMTQWIAILGGLVLLAGLLGYATFTRWHNYRAMAENVAREKQILAELDSKQAQDLAIINRPDNHDVRERSDYINGLIVRKEVSWTKIFTDLEKMMPPHLRVLSMTPQVQEDKFMIRLQLGGDSRERAAELARRMEQSSTFRSALIVTENDGEVAAGQGDSMRFVIEAEYVPAEPAVIPPVPTTTAQVTAGGTR